MALNFPDNPTLNQVYTDATSGFSYEWDGYVWQSYAAPSSSNIKIVDNIASSFNGSTQTFALAVSGVSLTPANAQQLRVVLGGIVQEPGTDYTVLGSDISFTTAPNFGLDCSIVSLGPAVPQNTINDGSVTPAKLSTGGPYWNTSGDLYIAGITTVGNQFNVGTGVTITSNGIVVSGIVTATNYVSLSDENLKENIQTIDNALEKVKNIRGVSFDWKKDNTSSLGVIAQELQEVLPELVTSSDPKTVNYDGIIAVLIEAIKELENRIATLESL